MMRGPPRPPFNAPDGSTAGSGAPPNAVPLAVASLLPLPATTGVGVYSYLAGTGDLARRLLALLQQAGHDIVVLAQALVVELTGANPGWAPSGGSLSPSQTAPVALMVGGLVMLVFQVVLMRARDPDDIGPDRADRVREAPAEVVEPAGAAGTPADGEAAEAEVAAEAAPEDAEDEDPGSPTPGPRPAPSHPVDIVDVLDLPVRAEGNGGGNGETTQVVVSEAPVSLAGLAAPQRPAEAAATTRGSTFEQGVAAGSRLEASDLNEILDVARTVGLGEPEVLVDRPHVAVVRLRQCRGCRSDPDDNACGFEAGFLRGALSNLETEDVIVREIACRKRGDEHCDFQLWR